jgi:hypothetical protein
VNIVDFANANSDLITAGVSAEQVDTPGERFVTDGSIGATTSNTPCLVFVPEPSRWLMIATGVAFLAAVGASVAEGRLNRRRFPLAPPDDSSRRRLEAARGAELAAIVLHRDWPSVPSKQRVWRHQGVWGGPRATTMPAPRSRDCSRFRLAAAWHSRWSKIE